MEKSGLTGAGFEPEQVVQKMFRLSRDKNLAELMAKVANGDKIGSLDVTLFEHVAYYITELCSALVIDKKAPKKRLSDQVKQIALTVAEVYLLLVGEDRGLRRLGTVMNADLLAVVCIEVSLRMVDWVASEKKDGRPITQSTLSKATGKYEQTISGWATDIRRALKIETLLPLDNRGTSFFFSTQAFQAILSGRPDIRIWQP
jgi:hypothetical protein